MNAIPVLGNEHGSILAPANGHGAAQALIDAGAGEVYLGFHDSRWTDAFGTMADINRMSGFGTQANTLSFEELCNEIAIVRETEARRNVSFADVANAADDAPFLQSNGADAPNVESVGRNGGNRAVTAPRQIPQHTRLYCTFNGAAYTAEQVNYIARHYLPALAQAGADGIIVSSPQLAHAAQANGLAVVASTMCAVYNQDLARFYYNNGFRRVILPRDLTLDEIEAITAAVPELEYEAFLMRNGCVFADSHCLGLHRAGMPSLCRTLRESPWWEIPLSEGDSQSSYLDARVETARLHKECFHLNTCGLCALWRLDRAGIAAYKVVGRGDDLEALCEDVALAQENLALAQTCQSEATYLASMQCPERLRPLCLNRGLSCYYPEARRQAYA